MNRDAIVADEPTYRYGELAAVDQIGSRVVEGVAFIHRGRIVALDAPHNLKPQYGKRALRAEVGDADGRLEHREMVLDQAGTPGALQALFRQERVVTIHSEEASQEDIFIEITGRGLVGGDARRSRAVCRGGAGYARRATGGRRRGSLNRAAEESAVLGVGRLDGIKRGPEAVRRAAEARVGCRSVGLRDRTIHRQDQTREEKV